MYRSPPLRLKTRRWILCVSQTLGRIPPELETIHELCPHHQCRHFSNRRTDGNRHDRHARSRVHGDTSEKLWANGGAPNTSRNKSYRIAVSGRHVLEAYRRIEGLVDSESANMEDLGISSKLFHRVATALKDEIKDAFTGKIPQSQLHNSLLNRSQRTAKITPLLLLKNELYSRCLDAKFASGKLRDSTKNVDLSHPSEWYPSTRKLRREWHLHIGPTNSGKTYHALKRLEEAKTGVYCGPLRLLAHEVFMRLNAKGILCDLVTGDDRRQAETTQPALTMSCTVEMAPLDQKFDVAVIDEIQMSADPERGWAWTTALLGLKAKEVHLCGEERSLNLIQALAAACGDKLHVHRYTRLSPLKMEGRSLGGDLRKLRKGDCVVAFSVVLLHSLRNAIEESTGKKCAIIYGALPPETRAAQAALFNDPNNDYDFLVASNAIGMGLNLSIKRLIFQSVHRQIGRDLVQTETPELKQIAGRAGRYSSATEDMRKSAPAQTALQTSGQRTKQVGYVTTLEKNDYRLVADALDSNPEPLQTAGLNPADNIVETFASRFPPGTPLSLVFAKLTEASYTNEYFHLCDLGTQMSTADAIEPVRGMQLTDRLVFCASPIETRKEGEPELARAYARCVAEGRSVSILDFDEIRWELLSDDWTPSRIYLTKLERLHKAVIIFLWLSYRFEDIFVKRHLAIHAKTMVEERITDTLRRLSVDLQKIKKAHERMMLRMLREERQERGVLEDGAGLAQGHNRTQIPVTANRIDLGQLGPTEQASQQHASHAGQHLGSLEESAGGMHRGEGRI